MSTAPNPKLILRLFDEARKVFDAHKEPRDGTRYGKLIINIAAGGGFVEKKHNPNLPVLTREIASEVKDAYNAGASMWHLHPRDPDTGLTWLPLEKRLKIHKDWCDAVFRVAPDVITNVGNIYWGHLDFVVGNMVNPKCTLAETRMSPIVEPLIDFGPKNRYCEVGISLNHTSAVGGTGILGFNNKTSIQSDVKYLHSKGIKLELSPFKHSDIQNVNDWVINNRLAKPPFLLDTLLGVHNSPTPRSHKQAFDLFFTYLPLVVPRRKGVLWQMLSGGRYWLQLTIAAMIFGCDAVRIGMEDAVYWHANSDEVIDSNGRVVDIVVGIARALGREIATPEEARQMLGLPRIKRGQLAGSSQSLMLATGHAR